MAQYHVVQGLLFIVDGQTASTSTNPLSDLSVANVFCLLPEVYRQDHPEFLDQLQERWIRILNEDTMPLLLPDADKVRVVEIRVDVCLYAQQNPLNISTPSSELTFITSLLGVAPKPSRDLHQNYLPAVDDGNLGLIQSLLRSKVDIPCKFGEKWEGYLLHMAAWAGQEVLVSSLLEHGANIDCEAKGWVDSLDCTIISFWTSQFYSQYLGPPFKEHGKSFRGELLKVARILLHYGANLQGAHPRRRTPLESIISVEASRDSYELFNLLVEYGFHINAFFIGSILLYAYRGRTLEAFLMLLESWVVDLVLPVEWLSKVRDPSFLQRIYRYSSPPRDYLFACHLIKVVTLFQSHSLDDVIRSFELRTNGVGEFKSDCEEEVTRMRDTIIPATTLTLYDFLTGSKRSVVVGLRNESLAQYVRSEEVTGQYRIYGNTLVYRVQSGMNLQRLFDEGMQNLKSLSRNFKELPNELREEILFYLGPTDFIRLRQAWHLQEKLSGSILPVPGSKTMLGSYAQAIAS